MKQLIRYGVVGVANNLILYTGYLFFCYLGLDPKVSMTVVYLVSVVISFFGHRQFTFSHEGNARLSAVRYILTHIIAYAINFFLLLSLVDYNGYPHELVQAAAIFIVAAFLFVTFKYWVFNDKNQYVEN